MLEKIKEAVMKQKAKGLAKSIHVNTSLELHYSTKDNKKMSDYIKNFENKFYPKPKQPEYESPTKEELKSDMKNMEKELQGFMEHFEDTLKQNDPHHTKIDLYKIHKAVDNGKLNAIGIVKLMDEDVPLIEVDKSIEKIKDYAQKFNSFNKSKLKFDLNQHIDFSGILCLNDEDILLLEKEILKDIKSLKDLNFLNMKKELNKLGNDDEKRE